MVEGSCQAGLFILSESGLCLSPARHWGTGTQEQSAKDIPLDRRLWPAAACLLQGSAFSWVSLVMDCSFPFSPATRHSLQLDQEQWDHSKCSQHARPWCHRGGHSLSSVGQGCQDSRLEPLECRDLLVQNALFTGDLEMVQKFFPKNAAINLIIEARGNELRWTSRKRGACAGLGHGGQEVPRMGTRERASEGC